MTTKTLNTNDSLLARPVAPEDLNRGDYVAVLHQITEFPSYLWHDQFNSQSPHLPIRIRWQGRSNDSPLRVKAICLPFVFVKNPWGGLETLDVREYHLARLSDDYARRVWKLIRKQQRKAKAKNA